jgi:glutathione S-transferase
MTLTLYAHPLSSYSQKVLVALWENGIDFAYRHLGEDGAHDELRALWPTGRFPVLVDSNTVVAESSIIIEHLQIRHPGPVRLIPDDPAAALEVRLLDRIFDVEVMAAMQRPVTEALRGMLPLPAGSPPRAPDRLDEVRADAARALETIYGWLDRRIAGRAWATGDAFTMADCAAAPSLFYADWVHPIGPEHARLAAYRAKLLARPSFARAVEEARPYRANFPLGAPDRD